MEVPGRLAWSAGSAGFLVNGGDLRGSRRGRGLRRVAKWSATAEVAVRRVEGESTGGYLKSSNPYYTLPSPVTEVATMTRESLSWENVPQHWIRSSKSDNLALVDEHHDEKIRWTFREAHDQITLFATGMRALGVSDGEVVAMFSESSARATVADAGILMAGGGVAARGASAPAAELQYIYEHSESIGLIVENESVLKKLSELIQPADVKFIVLLWGSPSEESQAYGYEKIYSFTEVVISAQGSGKDKVLTCNATRDSLAALLYTSGTTGHPKAVRLTHGNILHQVTNVCIGSADPRPGETFLSILPVWHIFEKTAQQFFLARRACIVFTNVKQLRNDLAKHKPNFLVGVPRVFEVIYNGVITKMEKESSVKKAIFFFFLAVSRKYIYALRVAKNLVASKKATETAKRLRSLLLLILLFPLELLGQLLVWKKIRDGLGGQHKGSICGGGKLASHIEDFFECARLEVFVGYGLTETSPVLFNRSKEHNVRTSVGNMIPGTKVKILDPETKGEVAKGEQGVVWVKGPQVTSGYYKNEEANKKAFDADNYFDTGDLGWFSTSGDLVISGREKDVIVLSNGENIEPEVIEGTITESPGIEQVLLVGQDERMIGALVVPSLDYMSNEGWVDKDAVSDMLASGKKDELRKLEVTLMENSAVNKFYGNELMQRVRARDGYRPEEKVGKWRLLLEGFTQENLMMTQTLKVKRNVVCNNYEKEIAELYQ